MDATKQTITTFILPELSSRAFVTYLGREIEVELLSTFQGGSGIIANIRAVEGFPFLSVDACSQGETSGPWHCNGYRVRADFVQVRANLLRKE